MRPIQWTKNLIIFSPLLFAPYKFNINTLKIATIAFILFCFLSGGLYIINDLLDLKEDKIHFLKKKRPIASGKLDNKIALIGSLFLLILSISLSFLLNFNFALILTCYLILQLMYSFYTKKVMILNAFSVAVGFVLRALGGAEVIKSSLTSWFTLSIFFLAMLLSFGKQKYELTILSEDSNLKNICQYNKSLVEYVMLINACAVIIIYSLYTLSERALQKFQTQNLVYTIPFIVFGICRYFFILDKKEFKEYEKKLLADKPLILNVFIYVIVVIIILY